MVCPRCRGDNYGGKTSICYDCKEQLGKMWNQIHREVVIEERKKQIKIEYRRTKNGFIKVTTFKDNITASQSIDEEEYRKGISLLAENMANKKQKEPKRLEELANKDFAKIVKDRQDQIMNDLHKDKKKRHSKSGSKDVEVDPSERSGHAEDLVAQLIQNSQVKSGKK